MTFLVSDMYWWESHPRAWWIDTPANGGGIVYAGLVSGYVARVSLGGAPPHFYCNLYCGDDIVHGGLGI